MLAIGAPFLWARFSTEAPSAVIADASGNGRDGKFATPGYTLQQPGTVTEAGNVAVLGSGTPSAGWGSFAAPAWSVPINNISFSGFYIFNPAAPAEDYQNPLQLYSVGDFQVIAFWGLSNGSLEIYDQDFNVIATAPAGTFVIGQGAVYGFTVDGTDLKFYKNGAQVATGTLPVAINTIVAAGWGIGATWRGSLDELVFYSGIEMTEEQHLSIYTAAVQ